MAGSDHRFELAQLLSAAFDPIIDICHRLNINSSELESLLRVEFVQRLAATLPRDAKTGKAPSHEEVGFASGLNRTEVQKIRSKGRRGKSAQLRMRKKYRQHSKSARVLDLWKSDPRFVNSSGGPLGLPLDRQHSGPSFEDLVAEALPHTRHANVLKDLKRRGLIQVTDDIVRIRRVPRPLPTQLNAQFLRLVAEEMRRVGSTLLQTAESAEGQASNPLALFLTSEPVRIPTERLEIVRSALQEQVANFVHGFERDFSRKPKPGKTKDPGVVIGTSVYTFSDR